ncbi:Glucuronoxylan 4-O-methyltransferase 1 [Zostera marina]|uniref:Glucuronoxylan 4-O-methyltransferase 1 n=1 Tax=Zostera marina TaxID=29655 RepID=A0A0K9PWE5_ZOSMR|nr:Glucuronoxylan 4-O-methyltransferase 1 [Zostera marina]
MQQKLRKAIVNLVRQMKARMQIQFNPKVVLLFPCLLFLIVVVIRSKSSGEQPQAYLSKISQLEQHGSQTCNYKIPKSLAQTIIHYSISKNVPQQTFSEISVTAQILEKKSPCNFLVFGLGHDSLMWASLNYGGRTVFLEEDKMWIDTIKKQLPGLESHHVAYNTKVNQADELMESARVQECRMLHEVGTSKCPLSLKTLPKFVHETEWDLIMVDAPTGYFSEAPGRMGAIYTAGMMARMRKKGETHVFVHDVNRIVEDKFSNAFLCEGYMSKQEGRLRHFTIPSHMTNANMPFCP